jgi:hypothetical protein
VSQRDMDPAGFWAPEREDRIRCRARRHREPSKEGRRNRLGFKGRLGLGMLLVAVIVDLAVFELAARWSSITNSDPTNGAFFSRDAL